MNEEIFPGVSPADEHNRTLVDHVHPPDWVNPEPAERYNLVVIGAGTAGLVAAAGAAGLGAKVALVERHLMGGDCLNVGCVPSKTLIRAARSIAEVRRAGLFGIRVPDGVEVDFGAVMERVREVRARISPHDSARRFSELDIDVFLGEGKFTGENSIAVAGKVLNFKKAVIATGARAAAPPIEGIKKAGYLTNETVFNLTELPRRLAVIGGGPIGCEMAQAFQRLGAEVHLFHAREHILEREDPDAAEIVQQAFLRDGVQLHLNCPPRSVEVTGEGKVIHFESEGEERSVAVDEILVGVGRAPNVESLNLHAAGVDYDPKKGVEVDDQLCSSNKNVFCAGDVCMRYKFTHAADAAARIVIQNALFKGNAKVTDLTVPWCTYTDPEIAHVGLYEHEAKKTGINVHTFTRPFTEVDRAVTDGDDEGLLKIHVKEGSDHILGATIVAPHAGDMISEITVAMAGGLGLGKIAKAIHPYPTEAEAIKHAADAYNRTRLTPMVQGLFERWLKWVR
jgi:pyruvate/2-oxoglutarate dehydrogenase complex dihydrolipoamide dehydrogenase (E3) component